MIFITGATGTNGREVMRLLAARNLPVRAMVRDLGKAEDLRHSTVEVVAGDFDRPETLRAALSGVERAFLLTNSTERAEAQQLAFVEAARQSGVAHIVKLSQLHADERSPVRFLRYHAVVEQAIRASGMAYTFLRPNLFMQGLLAFAPTIKEHHALYAPAGDARVSVVDVRDIAAAAVAALVEPGHAGRVYDLTGPEALSHADIASALSRALGRPIRFVDVPPEAMRDMALDVGMPAWQVEGLLEDYAHYRRGEAQSVASGVEEGTGRPPRSFDDFVCSYGAAF
jgi:uncharacterized protein YbjT (DUF2867 family)